METAWSFEMPFGLQWITEFIPEDRIYHSPSSPDKHIYYILFFLLPLLVLELMYENDM
jgi:hypothetical protein